MDYDINQARDTDSWDGNFQVILLYSFMEYLALDLQNIKVSLTRMQKYILGKTIEDNNANNIKDFQGVSKMAWVVATTYHKDK